MYTLCDNSVAPPSRVLASATTGVVDFIADRGGDVDTIFGRASIELDAIGNPFDELNLGGYCRLFDEAAKQTGDGNFGLRFGQQFLPKQLGAIGYAATSAPTLAAALRRMEKYFPAHQNGTRFGLVQDTELLWLTYRIIDARIEARRQDAELSLGMFCNIFRHALGDDWAPVEICFEHEAPEGAAAHAECFGAPVRFGSHTNAIAFFRRDLDSTMPEADPYLYSIIESFLKSRTQINENPEDLAAVVREQIKMHLKESAPTLKDIAAVLGLSDHRLRRKLRSHGLSYQELLRAARRELALKYIADPDISLTEVALSLGYSELSAFSRAFHAWTGMYPQRYRRIKAGA